VTSITITGGTLVDEQRKQVVETIAAVNEGNPSVRGGSLVMKRIGEAVDVIQGGIQAMEQPQPTTPDPQRQFYQSGVPMEQRIFEPEKGDVTSGTTPAVREVQPTTGGVTTTSFIDSFVDKMGTSEGTTDHTDQLGISTLGYGVLPATAERFGFNVSSSEYADRKVLAKAVYSRMYDEATGQYPDVFNNLSDIEKSGVLSLYINLGNLPDGVVNALSQDTPDFDAAKTSLASVVLNSPRDNNEERLRNEEGKTIFTSNKGLSKRRAQEYNLLMEGREGFSPVTTVEVEGTREQPTFVWKDSSDNEVHRYTPSVTGDDKVYQGLDSGNTMDSVGV
jgi:hypothetical protein|tara:strand:+ start:168 stop:1169 length:1002 start_codon:yes stop_codon:yes gene_type:complete